MQKSAVVDKILCSKELFTTSEQVLAEYVAQNIAGIAGISINDLRRFSGVSNSTISRFCRKLGFENYRQFSLALSGENALPYEQIHITADGKDDMMATARKLCDLEIETLESTLHVLDKKTLELVVEKLRNSRRILIFASGGSVAIAYDLYHKLIRLSLPCEYQQEQLYQKMIMQAAQEGDCVFAISLSGYDKNMVWVLEQARKKKIFSIALTNGFHSPITRNADACLYGTLRDDFTYTGTIESRLSQLFIIDLLFIVLSMQGAPKTLEALRLSKEVLDSQRVKR